MDDHLEGSAQEATVQFRNVSLDMLVVEMLLEGIL